VLGREVCVLARASDQRGQHAANCGVDAAVPELSVGAFDAVGRGCGSLRLFVSRSSGLLSREGGRGVGVSGARRHSLSLRHRGRRGARASSWYRRGGAREVRRALARPAPETSIKTATASFSAAAKTFSALRRISTL
jgi:hypothetical protein